MTSLKFSLSPEAIGQVSDALLCLAKFGESLSLEARQDRLILTALNLSKTAYAAFTLDAKSFFISYSFHQAGAKGVVSRFTGQLYNKALQCAFKARTGDFRMRDNTILRCDVTLQDSPEKVQCRLAVKMYYKQGMTKIHRLFYEPVQIMHALFDSSAASHGWTIRSRIMREYIEFFGPRTEQLDMVAQEGKVVFTSFTEKISDGREVLKQPLETVITLHKEEFEDFHMPEEMHIIISVKDFKAIVVHAESFHGMLKAAFSGPSRPLQLSYGDEGMVCEFTLMTTGDRQEQLSSDRFVSTRASNQRGQDSAAYQSMPPPSIPGPDRRVGQGLGSQSQANRLQPSYPSTQTIEEAAPESLFMPQDDETAWDPPDYGDHGQEEQLGYDASYSHDQSAPHPTFRDSASAPRLSRQISLLSGRSDSEVLEPTQRLSQLHGMFD